MMLLSARLRLRRNVKMKPLDIPPTPSAQSGPRRSALFLRKVVKSTPQSLDVPRNPGSSVPQLVADSNRELRSVMRKLRLLSKMPPRNSVLLSPNVPASTLQSLFPRRSAPGQELTQERSRSQLSRSGAMFLLRSPVSLKLTTHNVTKLMSLTQHSL